MSPTLSSRTSEVAVPSIAAAEALRRRDVAFVDLRSPSEFDHDHVPGARNVPLFDDVERSIVGSLYRKVSPEAAFREGRGIARAKIAQLATEVASVAGAEIAGRDLERRLDAMTEGGIEALESMTASVPAARPPERPVVLHCWRGGLRSRSVVAFLRGLGLDRVLQLEGGYKAYRAQVAGEIATWHPPPVVLLCGLTGVGKTLVLREIARRRPEGVLDLEGLAGHRSSLLGMVGLRPRSQKAFESALAASARRGLRAPLVVEGESRKVGDVVLPPTLWRAMEEGVAIRLVAPVERRVAVLEEDYLASDESRAQLAVQLGELEHRMDRAAGAEPLAAMLERGGIDELVRLLLERHYDPLYRRSERGRRYAATFDASDPACAADAILDWLGGAPPAVARAAGPL